MTLPITRTLQRGTEGTARLARRFGESFVCVRYRVDDAMRRRYKTVEIIVEEMTYRPSPRQDVLVQVGIEEDHLRDRIRKAGGRWDNPAAAYHLPRYVAYKLGLRKRIMGELKTKRKRPSDPEHQQSGNRRPR